VRRIIEAHDAGQRPGRQGRGRNFDQVKELAQQRVKASSGRVSAKRLLPLARAAGYAGSARNFRREQPPFGSLPLLRLELGEARCRGRSTGCPMSGSGRRATRCRPD
jgi:hypothetical protein